MTKGFTLVETLVAIAIFTLSILSMLSILSNGITSTTFAKNKIAATYLAQEGVELVRNLRDTQTMTSGSDWNEFLGKGSAVGVQRCINPRWCMIDASMIAASSDPLPCKNSNEDSCTALVYDKNSGLYINQNNPASTSIFKRSITVVINGATNDEIKVVSRVIWKDGSSQHNVTLSESLLNWIRP